MRNIPPTFRSLPDYHLWRPATEVSNVLTETSRCPSPNKREPRFERETVRGNFQPLGRRGRATKSRAILQLVVAYADASGLRCEGNGKLPPEGITQRKVELSQVLCASLSQTINIVSSLSLWTSTRLRSQKGNRYNIEGLYEPSSISSPCHILLPL